MAEAAIFSIGCKILSTVASPAFKAAYQKGLSIWEARDELDKLAVSIETIQAVLRDAEKKKEGSAAIRNWIDRVSGVLYDADDLFDEVSTDVMLKQQIKGDKSLKKVRAYCFKLNPIVSRNSIANQVKAIRKTLAEISNDMAQFKFVESMDKQLISETRKYNDLGPYVDSKDVIGRDNDKKAILEFLSDDKSSNGEQDVAVIAIVGIGGMGKTTLVQLVYNDKEVENRFEKRWFTCISDTTDTTEIIGKIFQSICEKNNGNFTPSQFQTEIRDKTMGKKFLLVLDDVWDDDRASWQQHRMSLLRGGAKGSKIIVTTRSLSVARAVGALETHNLEGLSDKESWDLFKRVAFTPEQENDPRWANIGREIVKKCARVPLAIRSIGSLLYNKPTIQEWESFKHNEMSRVELSGDSIMQTLKYSYDHLPFNLKPCFAYCSLFPKDYVFQMDDLISLWIAQGYIKPIHEMQTIEQAGYSYFMDLHRRCFFEKWKDWEAIVREEYKIHDLIHDLAQYVAGEEIITLTKPTTQLNKKARHVSFSLEVATSHTLNTNQLRSLFHLTRPVEDRQFTYGKRLRALILSNLGIQTVSSCIGELKHLRYLNLSDNPFESLPDSLMNLLNLLTLDINSCRQLKALPKSFRKLTNIRHLNIWSCSGLKHMPAELGELTSLQELSDFKVGKVIEGVQSSGLDVLSRLQLRGVLSISFERGIDNWDGDECWKLPVSLERLMIHGYPGRRIPHWSNHPSLLPNLSRLILAACPKVKYLPPLRCLPNLKLLVIFELEEIEYIEEEGEEDNRCTTVAADYINHNASFFSLLEELTLETLPQLKEWSRRKVLSFPLLLKLKIKKCYKLASFPLCPSLQKLKIDGVDGGMIQHLLSAKTLSSLKICHIEYCRSLENLRLLVSPLLEDLKINGCNDLTSVEVEALPSLASLQIVYCQQLKILRIAHLNALLKLRIWWCSEELELWGLHQEEERRSGVDWDSLPNLHLINFDRLPSPEELADCLRRRQALGLLQITDKELKNN